MLAKALITAGAAVIFTLGCVHLALTFLTDSFSLRDAELETRLKHVSPNLSSQLTMWKAWIGFNASHAMGLILFGLVYGYLAQRRSEMMFHSPFLAMLGALMLCGLLVLAKLYWFSGPLVGLTVASALYAAGFAVALTRGS